MGPGVLIGDRPGVIITSPPGKAVSAVPIYGQQKKRIKQASERSRNVYWLLPSLMYKGPSTGSNLASPTPRFGMTGWLLRSDGCTGIHAIHWATSLALTHRHIKCLLQELLIQKKVKAPGAQWADLAQHDVLTDPLTPVLLSKHGSPAGDRWREAVGAWMQRMKTACLAPHLWSAARNSSSQARVGPSCPHLNRMSTVSSKEH